MALTLAQAEVRISELERLVQEQANSRKPVGNLTSSEKIEFYKALEIDPIINGFQTEKADRANGDYQAHEIGDVFKGEITIGTDNYYVKYKVTSLPYNLVDETGLHRITKSIIL